MKRSFWTLFSIAILSIALVGCGNFTIKGDDGEEVKINLKDLSKGEVNIETKDKDGETGSFSAGAKKLPDGFPKEIPLPKKMELASSSKMNQDGADFYNVTFTFSDDPQSYYDTFKQYGETKSGLPLLVERDNDIGDIQMINIGFGDLHEDGAILQLTITIEKDENQIGQLMYSEINEK